MGKDSIEPHGIKIRDRAEQVKKRELHNYENQIVFSVMTLRANAKKKDLI